MPAASRNVRGSSPDRRRRREWIVDNFGISGVDGRKLIVPCFHCGKRMRVKYHAWEVDRYPLCGHDGGRYLMGLGSVLTLLQRRALYEELRNLTFPSMIDHDRVVILRRRLGNVVPSCKTCNNLRCTVKKKCRGSALYPGGRANDSSTRDIK